MRIAVLAAAIPFVRSPARRLAAELVPALEQQGHAALLVNLPLPAGPLPVEHVLALRALRLPNVYRAIALGFPACAVPHPRKVVWLAEEDAGGETFARARALYLRESLAVYAASLAAARRVREESGTEAGVLIAPVSGGATYSRGEYGDYVVCSEACAALACEAMGHTRSGARLEIASESRLADLLSGALACICAPGGPELEAYQSRKPVIACGNAAPLLVRDGATGLAVPPEPRTLAAAIDRLCFDKAEAQRMGEAGYARMLELNITWRHVAETLAA